MKRRFAMNNENALTEGAEVADLPFGIANYKSHLAKIANVKSEICRLRFSAQRGYGRKACPFVALSEES